MLLLTEACPLGVVQGVESDGDGQVASVHPDVDAAAVFGELDRYPHQPEALAGGRTEPARS